MITVYTFYQFVTIPDKASVKTRLDAFFKSRSLKGTILLGDEGVNATISGSEVELTETLSQIREVLGIDTLTYKKSHADDMPFHRLKVRLKNEIVTIGDKTVKPDQMVGTYVDPKDWNAIISDPDVITIDTRNVYETEIGTFKGAVDPHTTNFREFPDYVKNNLDPQKHKKVAMFCTGGIRCEKASSYMLNQGFETVYHLNGGILKYLEEVPESESLWQGECFVFDGRVSVKHNLELGSYHQCYACRHPISDAEMASPHYKVGVSCPKCYAKTSADEKLRFQERQKQVELAAQKGIAHFGPESQPRA